VVRAAVLFDDFGREGRVAASTKIPDEENSGGWVFHCHILEHADSGMMSFLEVFDE
jgi:FtsP/CotA-like multicopper oxidase with cupredoxin domain